MYLVDTNIHAAYLLQEGFEHDELTKEYLAFYSKISLAERIVPDFILGEFETFMMRVVPARYRLNQEDKRKLRELALDYIQRLTHECTIVAPSVEIVQAARDIFFENVQVRYLSFFDCLILTTAKYNDYTILTMDTRMTEVARKMNIPLYDSD